MELSKETLSKLSNLIDDAKKNKTYEFEVRFWGKNKTITEDVFQKIFQKMSDKISTRNIIFFMLIM